MDIRIQKVLETWHGGTDYDGKMNMALSLVGEIGEITNLYRKMFYKPGYEGGDRDEFLDELGDVWYYIRLFAYFTERHDLSKIVSYAESLRQNEAIEKKKLFLILNNLHHSSLEVEDWVHESLYVDIDETLGKLIVNLAFLLEDWECSLEELTELNYQKLTANQDHHGWKNIPMGIDHATGESKSVVSIWKKEEEDGSFTSLGSEETLEEAIQKLNPSENFKMRYKCQPIEEEHLGSEEEPPLIQANEEDWWEQMQKRIRANEQRSRELRGKWY